MSPSPSHITPALKLAGPQEVPDDEDDPGAHHHSIRGAYQRGSTWPAAAMGVQLIALLLGGFCDPLDFGIAADGTG